MYLNKEIFNRFGQEIQYENLVKAFLFFLISTFENHFDVITNPELCDDKIRKKLYNIRQDFFSNVCYQTLMNPNSFQDQSITDNNKIKDLIKRLFLFSDKKEFSEYFIILQIILNILYNYKFISDELNQFLTQIEKYTLDFPILGIQIKKYKTKAPQIFPFISELTKENIDNTLNILEKKKFTHTIQSFEEGVKGLLTAKEFSDFKNVIEDMHGACDELVKEVTGHKNQQFSQILKKENFSKFGLNGQSKEIYKNLKDRIDNIKHGTLKNLNREETRAIVNMTASFIQIVINNYKI